METEENGVPVTTYVRNPEVDIRSIDEFDVNILGDESVYIDPKLRKAIEIAVKDSE